MTRNKAPKLAARRRQVAAGTGYLSALRQLSEQTVAANVSAASHAGRYTGAWPSHSGDPFRVGIPVARTVDQMRLEAAVMEQVCRAGGFFWAHPFGIAAVHPTPRRIVLELDDHMSVPSRGRERSQPAMADFIVRHLLPSQDDPNGNHVDGIPGLRVVAPSTRRGTRDLHLVEARGHGRLVLRAADDTDWRAILDEVEADQLAAGYAPLWRCPEMSVPERRHRGELPRPAFPDSRRPGEVRLARCRRPLIYRVAPLGSALLRRINMFYTLSTAYTTSSWVTGDRWIIEMRALHAAGHPHHDLLTALADAVWGLPLTMVDRLCQCRAGRWPRQCDFTFQYRPDRSRLELRFKSVTRGGIDVRSEYARAGAATAWLDRVLPHNALGTSQAGGV